MRWSVQRPTAHFSAGTRERRSWRFMAAQSAFSRQQLSHEPRCRIARLAEPRWRLARIFIARYSCSISTIRLRCLRLLESNNIVGWLIFLGLVFEFPLGCGKRCSEKLPFRVAFALLDRG